jgi:hypothetical protein
LEHIVASVNQGHIVATMTSDHIIATLPLDTMVVFDTVVAFVIPLVALLSSAIMMWCEEHLWNLSVLQRVHLLSLV